MSARNTSPERSGGQSNSYPQITQTDTDEGQNFPDLGRRFLSEPASHATLKQLSVNIGDICE